MVSMCLSRQDTIDAMRRDLSWPIVQNWLAADCAKSGHVPESLVCSAFVFRARSSSPNAAPYWYIRLFGRVSHAITTLVILIANSLMIILSNTYLPETMESR